MRKAAGVILMVFGIGGITMSSWGLVERRGLGVGAWEWGLPVLSIVVVGAGVSAIRGRAYWWAFVGAAVIAIIGAVLSAAYVRGLRPLLGSHGLGLIVLLGVTSAFLYGGVPGLLALIFLVKRRGEFQS